MWCLYSPGSRLIVPYPHKPASANCLQIDRRIPHRHKQQPSTYAAARPTVKSKSDHRRRESPLRREAEGWEGLSRLAPDKRRRYRVAAEALPLGLDH